MIPKVLIFVDDGQIDIMHTPGVEVAVLVEGEDVEIPDDWVGLLGKQHHSLPITVNRAELPQKRPLACDSESLTAPNTQVHHATARLNERVSAVVDEQAKDEGLWFQAETAPEAYLQQELRRLHTLIESEAIIPPRLSDETLQDLHDKEETTRRNVAANLMKHPYCFDCGDNHLPGACPAS